MRLRDLHLQRDDLLRTRLRVREARQRQHLGDVRRVVGAKLGHRRVGRDIIIAVGKPEPALHHIRHRPCRIVEVLSDENAEQILGMEVRIVERVGVGAKRMSDGIGERTLVGNRLDLVDVGLDRRDAALLDPIGVGIGLVVIGDPRLVAAGRVRLGDVLDQVGGALLGLVVDHRKDRDVRLVGRDDGVVLPGAVGIFVEIVASLHRRVHQRLVDARLGTLDRFGAAGIPSGGLAAGGKRDCGRGDDQERAVHLGPFDCFAIA